MKTLILYASKNGGTKEIAQRIASQMDNVTLCDLSGEIPQVEGFDCIVVGSSVYAAQIRKEALAFLAKYEDVLYTKRVGLFLSGIRENQEYWQKNFPSRMLADAKAAKFMGGIFDPKRAGLMDRFVMRVVGKIKTYHNDIDDEKILEFVNKLKS